SIPRGVAAPASHSRARSVTFAERKAGARTRAAGRPLWALTSGCHRFANLPADRRPAGKHLPHLRDGARGRLHLRHVRHRRRLPDDAAADLHRRAAGGLGGERVGPYRGLLLRRRAADVSLALMLLSAGIIGTATGVWLFTLLRALDQLDLVIGISYVVLLTTVGVLMINEGLRAELRARRGMRSSLRRPGSHNWLHGLPLKMRFKRSKIYVSAIPVWGIGFIIGFVGAIMGIGGGFLLVPMLIYFLRVPTATVIGTSMILTLITMASATVMHAATNHLVDAILAVILMVGGVIG